MDKTERLEKRMVHDLKKKTSLKVFGTGYNKLIRKLRATAQ